MKVYKIISTKLLDMRYVVIEIVMGKYSYFKIFLIIFIILLSSEIVNASDWPMFRANMQRSGFINDSIPPPFEISWKTKIGGIISSVPALMNGSIYIGSTDGFLYALNASDGNIKWKGKTNKSIYSSPAVEKELIFIGSDDGYFYAFDSKGNKKWDFKTGHTIRSSPLVDNGIVYFGSDDGYLYAVYTESGVLKWQTSLKESIDDLVRSSPTIGYNEIIYIPANVNLYAIYIQNGSLKWKKKIGFTTPLSVIVNTNFVYAVSKKEGTNTLNALNIQDGILEWHVELGGGSKSQDIPEPFVSFNDKLYMSYNNLYRVENKGLEKVIYIDDTLTAPVVSKDIIHIGSQNGYLYSFNLNGNLLDSLKVSNEELDVGAIGTGKLYATSTDNYVYGLTSAAMTAINTISFARSTIEHGSSIGVDMTKALSIMQGAENKLNESKFKEAILEAEAAKKTSTDSEITYVNTKITQAERSLNEIRNFGYDIKNIDDLLQDARDSFSKNEMEKSIEKSTYVEVFSGKIFLAKSKIQAVDRLYGNTSVFNDKIKTIFISVDSKDFKTALEKIEILDVEVEKDKGGWTRTYIYLISINLILLILILILVYKNHL